MSSKVFKIKGRNIKWWTSCISCLILFVFIAGFSFVKMRMVFHGVALSALLDKKDNSELVDIKGQAKNAVYLTLNGREIFIDKDGNFNEKQALAPGLSVVTLTAQDKFGKTSLKKFEIYQKENSQVAIINN